MTAHEKHDRQDDVVNCVAPGLTRTPLIGSLTRNETTLKASAALMAMGWHPRLFIPKRGCGIWRENAGHVRHRCLSQ